MIHPLFGLFAEPASTVLLDHCLKQYCARSRNWPSEFNFFCARIGTTGGDRLEIYGGRRSPSSQHRLPNCANLGPSRWKQHSTTR